MMQNSYCSKLYHIGGVAGKSQLLKQPLQFINSGNGGMTGAATAQGEETGP
jgi:hypothetical protein